MEQIQFKQQNASFEHPTTKNVFGVYSPDEEPHAVMTFNISDEELKEITKTRKIYLKQDVTNGIRLVELHAFMTDAKIPISGEEWFSYMESHVQENYTHDLKLRWPNENVSNTAMKNIYSSFKDFIFTSLGLSTHLIDDGWKTKAREWEKIGEIYKNVKM